MRCPIVLNTVCSLVRYRGLLLTEGGEDSRDDSGEDSRDTGSTSLLHADPAVDDAHKGCLEKVPRIKSCGPFPARWHTWPPPLLRPLPVRRLQTAQRDRFSMWILLYAIGDAASAGVTSARLRRAAL